MEALRIVQKMVWGPWLLGLFLAVGVLCMVRLRGFPIRHIRVWWGETVGSGGKGQLLTTCTALAATVGTREISRAWQPRWRSVVRVLCSGCGRRHFWGWRWRIRRFIWEFCMGADLMSIWKMGLEAVSLENAMPCFACWRRLEWDVWYRRGLWRIVCAMQRPCRRLEPVSYWQF